MDNYSSDRADQSLALPQKTLLQNRYLVESGTVLERVITYIATDLKTRRTVEIDENFNSSCWRAANGTFLSGISSAEDQLFLSAEPQPIDAFLENGTSYRVFRHPRESGPDGAELLGDEMRCPWCLAGIPSGSGDDCPVCGRAVFGSDADGSPGDLPVWSILAGKFLVGKCVSSAFDFKLYLGLELPGMECVAVREYFPAGSLRGEDDFTVLPAAGTGPEFRRGLEGFVDGLRLYEPCRGEGFAALRECFFENGTAYAVTDAFPGVTLTRYIGHTGVIPPLPALGYLRGVFADVLRMHDAGIAHTRLCPDLILTDGQRSLLLTPGGGPVPAGSDLPFLAPESGGGGQPASDEWSLAAITVFCLTGRAPDATSLGSAIPVPPGGWPSAEFERVLVKALSSDPSDRYGDVRDLYNALLMSFGFPGDPAPGSSDTDLRYYSGD